MGRLTTDSRRVICEWGRFDRFVSVFVNNKQSRAPHPKISPFSDPQRGGDGGGASGLRPEKGPLLRPKVGPTLGLRPKIGPSLGLRLVLP